MSKDKGRAIFGLKKITTSQLLRASRFEIGQLKSYIQELEHKISVLEDERNTWLSLTDKEKGSAIVFQKEYRELRKRVETLTASRRKLKKDYDELLSKFLYLKNEKV